MLSHTITELSSVKSNKTDLHHLVDTAKHALAGLKHTEQYDLPSFLTSMLVPCLPKPLQVEWEVHSRESRGVPPVEEFLEFVMFQADVLSTSTNSVKTTDTPSRPSNSRPEHPTKGHRAATTTTQRSTYGSNGGLRYECQLCPGSKHPLFQCAVFDAMTIHQRGEHMRNKKLL